MVQPRPGPARDGRAAGRAAARGPGVRATSTTRSTRRCPACGSCARPSPASTTGSTARGMPSAVQRGERQPLGRRARRADARGGEPRPREPRPLPAGLHRLRGAARRLQGVHRHPHPARGRARLRLHRTTTLRREMQGRGLSALLFSNPCNPTGKLVQGDELARWVGVAREQECSLLIDEFYSHYVWTGRPGPAAGRERRALRRGREPRSGGALRRPDQELALPGLARDLDGRAASR